MSGMIREIVSPAVFITLHILGFSRTSNVASDDALFNDASVKYVLV